MLNVERWWYGGLAALVRFFVFFVVPVPVFPFFAPYGPALTIDITGPLKPFTWISILFLQLALSLCLFFGGQLLLLFLGAFFFLLGLLVLFFIVLFFVFFLIVVPIQCIFHSVAQFLLHFLR